MLFLYFLIVMFFAVMDICGSYVNLAVVYLVLIKYTFCIISAVNRSGKIHPFPHMNVFPLN